MKIFEKGLGPLGGVLSAMKWIKENQKDFKWIATFPVDTPFFKRQILKDFIQNINFNESDLFFIKSNNTRHNIFGLWSMNLLDKLEKDLKNGERKVELWANNTGVKIINMEFSNNDPFFNINTKEDLKKLKKYSKMISYEKSKTILKKAKIKIKDETIKSVNSLNRVVSTNIYSNINYPAGNNAAFDGYAINSKDTNGLKKNYQKI